MDKILIQSNKTDERDKFLKILQYGSLFLKALLKNQDLKERFQGLFSASTFSRKMFRLFKGIHDIDAINKIFQDSSLNRTAKFLQIFTRLGFFFYFFFDNLATFSSLKVINLNTPFYSKSAMKSWFFGLFFAFLNILRSLCHNYVNDYKSKNPTLGSPKIESHNAVIEKIRKERKQLYINLLRILGDLIPASAFGTNIPTLLFGKNFSDLWIGIGGLVSAGISLYQAWP
ncbi:unnamed protein product [Blepharisma stoltei]|uniref:Peroxisomal membrane protein 11A n=1 Tax=Blepharisma stoltei TaxID=1481888 RepID=A0AAU9J0V3_9CILI|nr:unnamed protein product [Blepharisma stoltei]